MLNREVEKKIRDHESVASNLQQQVNNLVLQAGNPDASSAEIVQARGEYSVLNDRLNAIDNTINTEKTNILKEIKDEFTPAKEEVEKSRVDYFGIEHNNLEERLNEDFDNIHQRVNDSSLLPYDGTNITASDSYYGLIKDLSIKGRTLQNLLPNVGNWDSVSSCEINIENNSVKIIQSGSSDQFCKNSTMVKPSSAYTLIYNVIQTTLGDNLYLNGGSVYIFDSNIKIPNSVGKHRIKVTTSSTIPKEAQFRIVIGASETDGNYVVLKDIMLLEGDYTNTPLSELPFVEGIKSVGENEVTEDRKYKVRVKSCGKNLFDSNDLIIGAIKNVTAGIQCEIITSTKKRIVTKKPIKVKQDIKLIITNNILNVMCYYATCNNGIITRGSDWKGNTSYSLQTDSNNEIYILLKKTDETEFTEEELNQIKDSEFMIEEGSVATDYEPYKETVVEYLLDEPHMSLPNGVKDTIDEDDMLIKRIGKAVLDGSEIWSLATWTLDDVLCFTCTIDSPIGEKKINCISDKFKQFNRSTHRYTNEEGISSSSNIAITISKSKLTTQNVTGFKTWLTENPVTVYYELAEPIITQLEKPQLFSQDGTTHIFSDNLLPPTISCSIPSNVPAVISALRYENEELQKENITLTEQIEENNIINIETSLEQDARLTMLELGVN